MAIFSVEIPDEDTDRVVGAICYNYSYDTQIQNPDFDDELEVGPDNVEMIDNPESQAQFANRMTREFLMNHTYSYELKIARESAESSVQNPPAITDPDE
tara:strand:+ start:9005 stop:9301 length:297 start_codon:yes stop_codon:yes gene_type:complete